VDLLEGGVMDSGRDTESFGEFSDIFEARISASFTNVNIEDRATSAPIHP
jgi:hypothetical protein